MSSIRLQFLGLGEKAVEERGRVDCGLAILERYDHTVFQSLGINNVGLGSGFHLRSVKPGPTVCLSAGNRTAKMQQTGVKNKESHPPWKTKMAFSLP